MSHKISAMKAVTWRTLGTFSVLIISYLFTGSFAVSGGITVVHTINQLFLYFIHERLWERWRKNRRHPIVWITGQPGSGKTTLAEALKPDINIDGDHLRGLMPTGYDERGRRENIHRAQVLALFFQRQGYRVAVSLVSPYRDQREEFKQHAPVVEVYLTSSEERGREHFFAEGYERPLNPDVEFDTATVEVKDEVRAVHRAVSAAAQRARVASDASA